MNRQEWALLAQTGDGSVPSLKLDRHFSSQVFRSRHIAVVSSRLGRSPWLHQHVGQVLASSARRCRARGERWLVAMDSAISPWAMRAAELYDIPYTTLAVDAPADLTIESPQSSTPCQSFDRDLAVCLLADEVVAAFVRRGGVIHASLLKRLKHQNGAATHVSVTGHRRCAGKCLIQSGAVGHYRTSKTEIAQTSRDQWFIADEPWTRTRGRWLVHCTRACQQNWPDETLQQYRDAILLGSREALERGPLDSLRRILRSGRLVASAITSRHDEPVVCFSALPLNELLARRCFRPHVGRWNYEPFGIAIRRDAARQHGIEPVIYGEHSERNRLPPSQRYRFHPIGIKYDWQSEEEWRSCRTVDLRGFEPKDVRVFAAVDPQRVSVRLPRIPWRITAGVKYSKGE